MMPGPRREVQGQELHLRGRGRRPEPNRRGKRISKGEAGAIEWAPEWRQLECGRLPCATATPDRGASPEPPAAGPLPTTPTDDPPGDRPTNPALTLSAGRTGPAALNRAWTLINDVRDCGNDDRLKAVAGDAGCHACHSTQICQERCPKHLSPTASIAGLKRAAALALLKGKL